MSSSLEPPARHADAEASVAQAELTTSADGVVLASDADAEVLGACPFATGILPASKGEGRSD